MKQNIRETNHTNSDQDTFQIENKIFIIQLDKKEIEISGKNYSGI